jgi:hypothetical protein
MRICFRCKKEWKSDKRVPGVKESCESCGAYLHCCKNCRHHDPKAHNQCLIPNTEWVGDREGCNFCDEFEFPLSTSSTPAAPDKDKARAALEGLFGGARGINDEEKLDQFKKLFEK